MELFVLAIAFPFNNTVNHIYPVVLHSQTETILVDCGYAGFMPLLQQAFNRHGLSLSDLTGIIITHHDIDHMGCAYDLKEAFPSLKVYASVWDEPYVCGKEKSLRLKQAEDIYNTLPEVQKPSAKAFEERLKAVRPVNVDGVFAGNEEPASLPGVQIIHTPGHMPGHISLYLKESKTLIAADALVYQDGQLDLANPAFTMDKEQALASVRKLRQLNLDKVICFHGGMVNAGINSKLDYLLAKYS